jgi:hypothetical protein
MERNSMMNKSTKNRIEAVRRVIYQHEVTMNPHYDINPEIVFDFGSIGGSGRHQIRYEVEYISRLDNKWRKWYTKNIAINIEAAIAEYRDLRLEEILKDE